MINQSIRIFVITFRRPHLLKRALASIIAQTYQFWIAEVVNDDPNDTRVQEVINDLADHRIILSSPQVKRGGTGNFNYAFTTRINEPFASILEDDNWYEPTFLEEMVIAMQHKNQFKVAVGNENIWLEKENGNWINTQKTIWQETTGSESFKFLLKDKCGFSKICNSSMMWRTGELKNVSIPDDLPVDLTEHFRERMLPHPILLVKKPLVNFAETIFSHRSDDTVLWGSYQVLLIASVFNSINANDQQELANQLWEIARKNNNPYKTTLMHTALAHKAARILIKKATLAELGRYLLTWLRRPISCFKIIRAPITKYNHFHFLEAHLN